MTITSETAEALAREAVAALSATSGNELILMRDRTIEAGGGWVFFYNSREFVETGDPISGLAGNGPIFVDQGGAVRHLPSAIPWEEAIRKT